MRLFPVQRPRSFLARADAPAALLVLPRREFERMAKEAPALATLLQVFVMCFPSKHFCSDVTLP